MASKIERVIGQVSTTFPAVRLAPHVFDEEFATLKRSVDELDSLSVGLDSRLLQWDVNELHYGLDRLPSSVLKRHLQVPVTYVQVFESASFTVGLFVLRAGAKLPLHDHSRKYGLLKVLHGSLKIQSYTPQPKFHKNALNVSVIKLTPVVVGPMDDPCVLSPVEGNIHEIETVDGPAAFIDVVAHQDFASIPVVTKHRCNYYKVVNKFKTTKLKIVSGPTNYWSDLAPYTGPAINVPKQSTT